MLLISIMIGTAGCLLVLFGLSVLSRMSGATRRMENDLRLLRSELDIKERTLTQQRQSLTHVKQETANLSSLLLLLPELAKQLSAVHTTQEVEENLVILAQKLLDAKEVSLFAAEKGELVLRAHRGLSSEMADALQRFKIGEGRIGWTAKKQVMMTTEDFEKESNLAKASFQQGRFIKIRTDLCAPLVHRDRFYGVINIGEMRSMPENSRRLMTLICNLGVIALENVLLLGEIQKQADLDPLTKLYNVTYYYKYLDHELQKAQRYNRPLVVVIFDLDQFESYNRLFGRMEGDKVLRIVGNLIKEGLRTVDIPCRYGGEEMAIVLPETDQAQGLFVAERTRRAVESHPFSLKRVTLSGGLAVYPTDGKDPRELMKKAEAALAKAKDSGRNRIAVYSETP